MRPRYRTIVGFIISTCNDSKVWKENVNLFLPKRKTDVLNVIITSIDNKVTLETRDILFVIVTLQSLHQLNPHKGSLFYCEKKGNFTEKKGTSQGPRQNEIDPPPHDLFLPIELTSPYSPVPLPTLFSAESYDEDQGEGSDTCVSVYV